MFGHSYFDHLNLLLGWTFSLRTLQQQHLAFLSNFSSLSVTHSSEHITSCWRQKSLETGANSAFIWDYFRWRMIVYVSLSQNKPQRVRVWSLMCDFKRQQWSSVVQRSDIHQALMNTTLGGPIIIVFWLCTWDLQWGKYRISSVFCLKLTKQSNWGHPIWLPEAVWCHAGRCVWKRAAGGWKHLSSSLHLSAGRLSWIHNTVFPLSAC